MRPAEEAVRKTIDRELPNGLHDAVMRSFHVDLVGRSLEIRFRADVSRYEAGETRARYVDCTLAVTGLWALQVETLREFERSAFEGQWIDGDVLYEDRRLAIGWPVLPDDAFAYWLFLRDRNAFIYFAGKEARLSVSG